MASVSSTSRHLVLRALRSSPAQLTTRQRQAAFQLRARAFSTTQTVHERRYTKDHEWIDLPPNSPTGTIGISTYAAHALGDVVYVELPTVSEAVSAGDTIGAVESVKSASDIKAPVAGTIVEVNALLESKAGVMGTRPEDGSEEGGWVARIEVGEEGRAEVEGLMSEESYKAFIEE